MERKEKILAYINSKEYIPLKSDELITVLDVPVEDKSLFIYLLDELCREGKIYITKKGRYMSVGAEGALAAGRLSCNAKGFFGFVICDDPDEEDIFISGDGMMTALNNDKVLVRIDMEKNKSNHRQGHIVKVLERRNKIIVGVIYKEKNGYMCVRPDNRQIYTKIFVPREFSSEAQIGDRVAVCITEYCDNGNVIGEVVSILGDKDSLKSCIEGIIISNDIKQEFDKDTLLESEHISQTVSEEQIDGREDLRDMLIFTIDGDDARDFDDAVSLNLDDNGSYHLGVHIADVSEYVTDGSALEREAYERATSVYLADRVIPMLPQSLSNGICSLNPNVDRLTLSVFMEITGNGTVVSHRICKSVICSKERMTYNNVNLMLEDNDDVLCDKYSHLLPTLKLMEALAKILNGKRAKRGAIQFDFPESKIKVNEEGEPIEISKEIRGVSNKMIEEFMLAANETVAEYAFWSEIPFIFRNHEPPSLEKITAFNDFLRHFGLSFKGKIDRDNPVHPKTLQQVLDHVAGTSEERIVSYNMLHSLMKAKYSEENLGHFGLAAKYYCHFTSPIRRYPDLAIHRILKAFIDGNLERGRIDYLKSYVSAAARHASDCEANAEHSERDVDDLMKTAYMSSFIGQTFEAKVANVTNFGMFVELDNTVEGLVRVENMTDDYYEYNETTNALVGRRKKRSYTTGDSVKVVLANTDILLRQIDFVLEKDSSGKLLKSFEKKTRKELSHETKKVKTKKQSKYKRKKKQ